MTNGKIFHDRGKIIINLFFFNGENNLKFILFVLNQMNCVVPSFDSVKKIALTGFDAPTKV